MKWFLTKSSHICDRAYLKVHCYAAILKRELILGLTLISKFLVASIAKWALQTTPNHKTVNIYGNILQYIVLHNRCYALS